MDLDQTTLAATSTPLLATSTPLLATPYLFERETTHFGWTPPTFTDHVVDGILAAVSGPVLDALQEEVVALMGRCVESEEVGVQVCECECVSLCAYCVMRSYCVYN